MLELCTEDTWWLVEGTGGLQGRAAVEGWMKAQPSAEIVSLETPEIRLEIHGDLAVKRASFVTRLQARDGAEPFVVRGRHVWTLQRRGDLEWRVSSVAWSIAPSADATVPIEADPGRVENAPGD